MKNLTISLISRNRTEIMGIAILWIYLFHSNMHFPGSIFFLPAKVIKAIGYGGVDIFIFVSGFGLIYGMIESNHTAIQFYIRRFLKILPAYWTIVTIYFFIRFCDGKWIESLDIFLKMSTLDFWFGDVNFLWYIPAVLMLYLIFPPFYHCYCRVKNKNLMVVFLVLFSYLLCFFSISSNFNYLLIFLTRIPIFILGAHLGYKHYYNNINISYSSLKIFLPFLTGSLIVLIIIRSFIFKSYIPHDVGFQWYPFLLITYPLIVTLSLLFEKIKKLSSEISLIKFINKTIKFFGIHSLEIYLFHEHIVFPLGDALWNKLPIYNFINKGNVLKYLLFFILTSILAFCLKKITDNRKFIILLN